MASDRGNDRARDSAGDRAADKVGATLGRATNREQQAEQQAEQAAEQKTEQAIEAHHASGNFSHSTTSPTAMAGGGICSAAARPSESTHATRCLTLGWTSDVLTRRWSTFQSHQVEDQSIIIQ